MSVLTTSTTSHASKTISGRAGKSGVHFVALFSLLLVLLFVPVLSHATDIRGRVDRMNPLTNKPVPYSNAKVTLWKNDKKVQQTRTGRNGLYYIRNLRKDQYTIQVNSEQPIRITISSDRSQDIPAILSKE